MATNFIPTRDADLVGFARNFDQYITASATSYGLTAAQATAFATLTENYINAFDALQNPATKSPSSVEAKNIAKAALIDGPGGIRQLANLVQAHPGITSQQLVDLRLTVRDREPTPVPVPTEEPIVEILSHAGRQITLRVHDGSSTRRAKPANVKGATIFLFVGEEPPVEVSQWQFNQSTTKPNRVVIDFPASVPDFAKVWIAAFWFNPTSQSGPLSEAISTHVVGGLVKKVA